jgi:hypothetical protein
MARATKLRVVAGRDANRVARPHGKTRGHDKGHGLPIGAPCPNCGTALAGAWCYACGQKGEEFHRSIWHLVAEAFEGLTHFDGRFWVTVPRLILKPGELTRDYLDGHRAPQIPPFRLFLIVLLAVFFTGSLNFQANHVRAVQVAPVTDFLGKNAGQTENWQKVGEALRTTPNGRWLMEHGEHALKNPEAFGSAMEHWSHQFAILMLPIGALLLTVLFAFKRGVYVFDHLIFSMHSLSFQGLLLSGIFLGGLAAPWAAWFLWIAPAHLFVHMRKTYRISALGTLVRMLLLFSLSITAFALLMMGLVFVGLATAH